MLVLAVVLAEVPTALASTDLSLDFDRVFLDALDRDFVAAFGSLGALVVALVMTLFLKKWMNERQWRV